ncbi:MAG: phosphotransferase [Sinobacteraceae bacterium]|nr:phosphotransferase [Nevskiaceae bacterium]
MTELQGLLALQGEPPEVTNSEAEEIALRLYGIDSRAEPLAGERDRNFRLMTDQGPRVLKFLDGAASDTIVAGQGAVLRHLAAHCALPLPRLLPTLAGQDPGVACTASGRWRVRLLTYLPGELLLQVHADRTLLRDVGRQIGMLDQALQDFTHPALAQQIAWDIRHLPRLSAVLPRIADPQARRLLTAALPPALAILPMLAGFRSQAIHGDCHPGNLLVSTSSARCTGIIDLGDLIHAPVILEIAVTLAETMADGIVSDDDLAALLSGFIQCQALSSLEDQALFDLLLARLCVLELIRGWREQSEERGAAMHGDAHGAATHEDGHGAATHGDATCRAPPVASLQALDRLLIQGRSAWRRRFAEVLNHA